MADEQILKKKEIDWPAVEAEYRAGLLSTREIGKRHGVSHVSVLKHAKKDNWIKDLKEKVKREITRKLIKSSVTVKHVETNDKGIPEEPVEDEVSDEEIIEAAAEQGAKVVKLHRADIQIQRKLAVNLLTELSINLPRTMVTKEGKEVEVTSSLKERSEIFRNLAQATAKYIPLERQAWSLGDKDSAEDNKPVPTTVVIERKDASVSE